jgi:hypothetical protein
MGVVYSTFMMRLPEDIKNKIDQHFFSSSARQRVTELLESLWTLPLNVGPDQLARSILILSNGQISEVENIFSTSFLGDPRDVIMQAENKIGHPRQYFIHPFIENNVNEPPDFLDGAKVIKWAWAEQKPFGYIGSMEETEIEIEKIFGLAICRFEKSEEVYRFSCNENWIVIQDDIYETVEDAMKQLPKPYLYVKANWQTK